ncbi:AI-2E family transporter [Cellulomonas sp. WB94]|nr:AI-2E family transporter [Cellulomonas sp. WB94]
MFSPRNVWQAGLVVLALVATAALASFVLTDARSVIFTVVMSWFASLAMEPAVLRLSRHMRRGAATLLVMAAVGGFAVVFVVAFGTMFVQQIAQLLRALPDVVTAATDWVNGTFSTSYRVEDILSSIQLTPSQATGYANQVIGGAIGIIGSLVGAIATAFTMLLLVFYLSADGPRLRRWVASLLPDRSQEVFLNVWDLTSVKTGEYVAARVVLATINSSTSALVFLVTGMPSWLALGIWTGLVAQFVPTIGTYISIALPVLVGLLSPHPWTGVIALAWAVVYQQVENLTFEPRISARAVNIHPAVAFVSVLVGASLFGIAGALLAVPICATLLSLLDIYAKRNPIEPEAGGVPDDAPQTAARSSSSSPGTSSPGT